MIIEAHAVNVANHIRARSDSLELASTIANLNKVINSFDRGGFFPSDTILPGLSLEEITLLIGSAHQATYKEIGNWGIKGLKTLPVLQKYFAEGSLILPTEFLSLPFRPRKYYLVTKDEGYKGNIHVRVGNLVIKVEDGIPVYSLDKEGLSDEIVTLDRTKVLGLVFSNKTLFDLIMPKVIEGYIKRSKTQDNLKQTLAIFLGRVLVNLTQ